MIKRVTAAAELRLILDEMENGPRLKKICSQQKHVTGEWDFNHLKSRLIQHLLLLKNEMVIFVYYRDSKPNTIFAGYVSEDWACNKTGLHEIIWVTVDKSFLDGVKILQEVEKFIAEKNIDYLECSYMCNGGDPRVQSFYAMNGFRLDTLSFVKNYK